MRIIIKSPRSDSRSLWIFQLLLLIYAFGWRKIPFDKPTTGQTIIIYVYVAIAFKQAKTREPESISLSVLIKLHMPHMDREDTVSLSWFISCALSIHQIIRTNDRVRAQSHHIEQNFSMDSLVNVTPPPGPTTTATIMAFALNFHNDLNKMKHANWRNGTFSLFTSHSSACLPASPPLCACANASVMCARDKQLCVW